MKAGSLKPGDLVCMRDWDVESQSWVTYNDAIYMVIETHDLPGYDTNQSIDVATIFGNGIHTVVMFQHLMKVEQ